MADEIDERLARGMATALELFKPGSAGPPSFKYPKEIVEDWNQLSVSTVLGDVWGRPALEKKQRAMITIAVLTALSKPEQLRAYITGGLNLGLTRKEICEIILHISVYAGFPTAIQGFAVANEVFEQIDEAAGEPLQRAGGSPWIYAVRRPWCWVRSVAPAPRSRASSARRARR
jgi:4-carboxymuconolactone decarboxylase